MATKVLKKKATKKASKKPSSNGKLPSKMPSSFVGKLKMQHKIQDHASQCASFSYQAEIRAHIAPIGPGKDMSIGELMELLQEHIGDNSPHVVITEPVTTLLQAGKPVAYVYYEILEDEVGDVAEAQD